MIELKNKRDCCGCAACVQRCPVQCISLREDNEGFLYPHINLGECIGCDVCDSVCPMINESDVAEPLKVYAAKSLSDSLRSQSSSGGIFAHLAEQVITAGGAVVGAVFDKDWQVCHTVAQRSEEVAAMRGSKYLQSRIGETFLEVEELLKQGREVLFSGTPCQVASLKLFLGRDYDTLLLVDIACHGVPSPKVWRQYLSSIAPNGGVEEVNFRDKTHGWHEYNILVRSAEQTLQESHIDNIYMQGFIKSYFLRPSCYSCPVKGGRSGSDITLADYWNIRRVNHSFDDDKGVSLLLVNSPKGEERVASLEIESVETQFSDAIYKGSALNSSPQIPAARAALFEAIDGDVVSRLKELLSVPLYTKIIRVVKRRATKIFKL